MSKTACKVNREEKLWLRSTDRNVMSLNAQSSISDDSKGTSVPDGVATCSGTSGAGATGGTPLNASHMERRRQKKKFAIKRLEKKLENYHRQIKKLVK